MLMREASRRQRMTSLVTGSAAWLCTLLLWGCSGPKHEPLRFAALGAQFATAPAIVAVREKIFQVKGVEVGSFDMTAGVFAKDSVVNGNADVAVVANTPLALSAAKGEDIVVLARIMYSDKMHALVSRSANPVDAQPIAYVPGTSSEFFLRSVLDKAAPAAPTFSSLKLVQLRPPGIVPAFNSDSVATVSMWEPFVSDLSRSKSPPYAPIEGVTVNKYPGLYPFAFYIVTSRAAWGRRSHDILLFLDALRTACHEINADSSAARSQMETLFGYPKGWLEPLWADFDFHFNTDVKDLRPPIENDAKLAVESGVIKRRPDIGPLFALLPEINRALHVTLSQ